MIYALFLDDERFPPTGDDDKFSPRPTDWRIARNLRDAQYYIETFGLPQYMSLDHDLGEHTFTGMDFVKWLCDYIMNNNLNFRDDMIVYVHSQNPVGAENMREYWKNFSENYS